MQCEKIRELLLTDHMDGELEEALKRELEEHIAACSACREFQRETAEKVSGQLASASAAEAPSYIWGRVRQRIAADSQARRDILPDALGLIRQALSALLKVPKPAIAFVAAAMVIAAILVARPIMREKAVNEYLNDQVAFLTMLDTEEPNNGYFFDTEIRTGAENLL